MPQRRHLPQRTCSGCGAPDSQANLLRVVLSNQGELRLDRSGPGRGGYLHRNQECWRAFLRRKSTHRAFHVEVGRAAKEKLIRELLERDRE